MYRRSKPGKIIFEGFTIVRLPESCTRTAEKFYRNGWVLAVLQKNGNVAITDNGIFTKVTPLAAFKTARCLHGLGLIGDGILLDHQRRATKYEEDRDLAELQDSADNLGYKLVKLPKPKTVPVRK